MRRAALHNLGCKVNSYETEAMAQLLEEAGYEIVDFEEKADVYIINTCSVTNVADKKSRQMLHRAKKKNPEAVVVAAGCYVQAAGEQLKEDTAVDLVIGNNKKAELVPLLEAYFSGKGSGESVVDISAVHEYEPLHVSKIEDHTRAFIKVQDGCNNRCSYCIVWKARGPERSVPVASVLEQVRRAERAGIPEVVLTGVNLGAYDGIDASDSHVEIDELLDIILEQTNIPQVRLSSLEPMDVHDRLIDAMVAGGERVAPFLHLPLQSGCTATLERMNRPYSAEQYEAMVDRIRTKLPNAAISCDIIAGFPGETDEEFAESRALCERVGFSRMHVFRYSARPGTPAATAPGQVAPEVMASRSSELRHVAENTSQADARARIGACETAVLEFGNRGTLGSFHRVIVDDAGTDRTGQLVRVRITGMDDRGLLHASMGECDL